MTMKDQIVATGSDHGLARGSRMTDAEKAALWRQRIFEAQTGMTRMLVDQGARCDVADWLELQADIFAALPTPGSTDPDGWQRVFFRTQALLEKFVIARYGLPGLGRWAQSNATTYRALEPDRGGGAADPVGRIGRQAELYASDYEFGHRTPASSSVTIHHCRIWDYREKARREGVPITLDSPCTYCTQATSANARAKGYVSTFRLTTNGTHHGCEWQVTAPDQDRKPARISDAETPHQTL